MGSADWESFSKRLISWWMAFLSSIARVPWNGFEASCNSLMRVVNLVIEDFAAASSRFAFANRWASSDITVSFFIRGEAEGFFVFEVSIKSWLQLKLIFGTSGDLYLSPSYQRLKVSGTGYLQFPSVSSLLLCFLMVLLWEFDWVGDDSQLFQVGVAGPRNSGLRRAVWSVLFCLNFLLFVKIFSSKMNASDNGRDSPSSDSSLIVCYFLAKSTFRTQLSKPYFPSTNSPDNLLLMNIWMEKF